MCHADGAAILTRPRSGLIGVFFLCSLLSPLAAQTTTKTDRDADGAGAIVFDTARLPEFKGEEAVSLFDFDVGDKRVEFLASGYWQSTIASTSTYSFGFGSTPGFSFGTPVFAQKVDLSLWFMLDRHWYFEADFADEFTKNTVAAGYVGDGIVKSVRIANRGIAFPDTYSIDEVNRGIGGGENQAPGISFHVAGEKWQSHAAVRYDMLKAEEKTWYGKNAVSTMDIALSQYQTGSRYVLPTAEAVAAVTDVYVEHANGAFRDAQGRRYKKLDASQYLLVPSSYTVLLAKDAGAAKTNGVLPAVAFSFGGMTADGVAESAQEKLIDDEEIGIKAWFETDKNPELSDVTDFFFDVRTDAASSQFVSAIDGERVLFVQHPAGFSPFMVAYRYDAGLTSATDAAVASHQTEATATDFAAVIGEDDISFVSEDFFYTTHAYADIYRTDADTTDMRRAAVRFPFASTDAGMYLGYGQKTDWELKIRTYTAVARFDIGTDAVLGTIRVYKNGMLDSGATYDSESGSITLSSAVVASDHIYATWYEDSEDVESGAIAAAAGFAYRPTDHLTTDVSLATRWTFAVGKDFADSDYASPGFATLASRVRYEDEHLLLSNTVSASVESENTTGTYRVLGMDARASDTVYLAKNAAVDLPDGFVPSLNERKNATNAEMPVSLGENCAESARDGTRDSGISGYAASLSWKELSNAGKTTRDWAGMAIRLPGVAGALASASSFSLALKNTDASLTDVSVYLQLGVQAEDDFSLEDTRTVPTWLISKAAVTDENPTDVRSAFVLSSYPTENGANGWQTVTVSLTEYDQSRLAYYHDARLIICSDGDVGAGTIAIGPYQADGVGFSVTHNAATTVSVYQTTDSALRASKISTFNTGTNYVQAFDWHTYENALMNADDFTLTASQYFEAVDMQGYETLSLWFRYNPQETIPTTLFASDDTALKLTLDRPDDASVPAVTVSLSQETLSRYRQRNAESPTGADWHELTVDLAGKAVSIDGSTVGTAQVNRAVVPVRLHIALRTADADGYVARGSFFIDELSLSGAQPAVVLQDKARAAWNKDGMVVETNGYALLRDVSLSATGTGSRTIPTGNTGASSGVLSSTAHAAFTLSELRITGDAAFSSAAEKPLASAAHSVETEHPLFGVLTLAESYSYNTDERALEKTHAVRTDFSTLGVPLALSAQTEAQSNAWGMAQKAVAKAGATIGKLDWSAQANVGQKMLPSAQGVTMLATTGYGQGWLDSTKLAFDTGNASASRRTLGAQTAVVVQTPWCNLKPTVTAETGGTYIASSKQTFSDDSAFKIAFPFSVGKHAFAFSWKKSGGGVRTVHAGGSYGRDMGDLRDAYGNASWLFTAVPVYDLISATLAHDVLAGAQTQAATESQYYAGLYEATWKRGFYGNKMDVSLPSNVALSFARDIRTAASTADVYQLKATVGYTALNVFGIAGMIPLATWFQQDEYAASLSAALKIPRAHPSALSVLVTGYAQANFFVTATHSYKTGVEGSFENVDNWSAKATAIWKRRAERSPVLSAITLFRPAYDAASAKLTRTDSLNLSASRSKATTATKATQKYGAEYTHALDFAVTKYVTINTLVGASYACTWDKIITISGTMSLGGTIRF